MSRSVLVTGGNRGIGRTIAEAFVANGDQVAITYRSGEPPEGVLAVKCDVTDPESVDAAFAEVEAAHGPVEVLVANAGITADTLVLRMSEDDWSRVIETNLTGSFRVAKRAAKGMLRLRRGRLIFISSVVGLLGSAGQVNYAASKAGLVGMARSLARELGSRSITANVVAPGFVETEMTDVLPEETKAKYKEQIPLGRYATTEEVASVVHFAGLRRRGVRHRGGHPRRRRPRHGALSILSTSHHNQRSTTYMGILEGKRILVAGVTMDSSIGFAVARVAQEQGATVVVSNFGRALGITKRIVNRLPQPAPVIELDVTDPEHLERLPDAGPGARRRPRRGRALGGLRQPRDAARRQVPAGPVGGRRPGRAGLGVLPDVAEHGLPAVDVGGRLGGRA